MVYKIDIRWHESGHLTDRTITDDAAIAETAYRALLARDDLIGQRCAARLVSSITGKSIYFSRFDRQIGCGRIHPGAPLNLRRVDDGSNQATAWQPGEE